MKAISLVSLDCESGQMKRYTRSAGNRPIETGRRRFDDWRLMRESPEIAWAYVWEFIQGFRTAWSPPEEPGPRPTSPLRTAKAA